MIRNDNFIFPCCRNIFEVYNVKWFNFSNFEVASLEQLSPDGADTVIFNFVLKWKHISAYAFWAADLKLLVKEKTFGGGMK